MDDKFNKKCWHKEGEHDDDGNDDDEDDARQKKIKVAKEVNKMNDSIKASFMVNFASQMLIKDFDKKPE